MSKPQFSPLALAVLALVFERPMHPYEMAATLKHRRKHESIKLRYGTLYTVIDLLAQRGLIRPKETSRGGKRPERTVYALTPAGRDRLRDWMRDLVAQPAKEFPQFEAALCLLPVLPPEEALALLRDRRDRVAENIAGLEQELARISAMTLEQASEPDRQTPAPLLDQKFPAIFIVESRYRLALLKTELEFVSALVRDIAENGWGPVELWRTMQATCEREFCRENQTAVNESAGLPARRQGRDDNERRQGQIAALAFDRSRRKGAYPIRNGATMAADHGIGRELRHCSVRPSCRL
jgi:DNA-binding PadR family transcriptional regulator